MLQINASITRHNKRIWCSYRTQHLHQYNAHCFLSELNADFEPISEKQLIADNNNTAFEDVRLFSFNDKLLAFYNYFPFVESIGWQKEYRVGFGEVDIEKGFIKNQISFSNLSIKNPEQNWVPFVYKNELFMVTDFDPFLRVIKIGLDGSQPVTEEVFTSSIKTVGWDFGHLIGGTPLIGEPDAKDNWLYGFVHSFLPDYEGFKRRYYFTLVRYDHLNKIFEYHPSPLPYNDDDIGEEYDKLWQHSNGKFVKGIFPIGLMAHEKGVVASFGKDEVVSYTEYFSWARIKSFFND